MKKLLLTLILGILVIVSNAQIKKLQGPRLGFTLLTPGWSADIINEGLSADEEPNYESGSSGSAFVTQYGWQLESRFADGEKVVGIVEWIALIGGMEKGLFLPSVSSLVGLRSDAGIEFDGDSPRNGPLGGVESSIVNLVEEFVKLGHKVSVRNMCQEARVIAGVDWAPLFLDKKYNIPKKADLYILSYESIPEKVNYKNFKIFQSFLEEQDIWDEWSKKNSFLVNTDINEIYTRYAKSLINVVGGLGEDLNTGLLFELIALNNPYISKNKVEVLSG